MDSQHRGRGQQGKDRSRIGAKADNREPGTEMRAKAGGADSDKEG